MYTCIIPIMNVYMYYTYYECMHAGSTDDQIAVLSSLICAINEYIFGDLTIFLLMSSADNFANIWTQIRPEDTTCLH